jgi:hypothetical protein
MPARFAALDAGSSAARLLECGVEGTFVRPQFLGGAAPAPPFPGCGSVPEEDLLGCPEAQAACY